MALSRSRKLELIRGIKDEDFLRTEVMLPIYRNMGKFAQVIDHHGATERGTDIVLVEKSPFGDLRYTSVILKATPINNASSGKQR